MSYSFDSQGRIAGISVEATPILSSGQYQPFGPVRKWTWANNQSYAITHDLDGRIQTLTLGPAATGLPDLDQVYGYDSLNRLTAASITGATTTPLTENFAYDPIGNRLTNTLNGATTTYTYPTTSHRLQGTSGATAKTFGYDSAGNVTNLNGMTLTYDGRGRLKQAGTTTYKVNGLGQRVKKTTTTATTYFVYDEQGKLIGEYDINGSPIQETIWFNDLPVAVLKPKVGGGYEVFYIWADHLGSPRAITRPSDGKLVWEWKNESSFGNNLPNDNPSGLGVFKYPHGFPGQYCDEETGTCYNYYRDNYFPDLGRYGQFDPIGLAGGLNGYAYVGGNPLSFTDPTGLVKWDGGVYSFSLIGLLGATYNLFELTSECACGKQMTITVQAVGPSVGLGLKIAGSYSPASFEDGQACPDANGFNGKFLSSAAGLTFGAVPFPYPYTRIGFGKPGIGVGLGIVRLGSNTSDPFPPGPIIGRDASISGTIGSSTVTSVRTKDCECKK